MKTKIHVFDFFFIIESKGFKIMGYQTEIKTG